MASIMVSGQWKLALRVAAAGIDRERNEKAQQGIIERCSDVIPEGTVSLTVEEAQYYISRQIDHDMELARLSDDDNVGGEVEVLGSRLLRDESYAEVYRLMIKAKQGVQALFDSRAVSRLLGPAREVPADPVRLYQVADRCRRWLSDPEIELGEGLEAFNFDPAALVAGMEDPVARLRTALETLQADAKDGVDRLKAKRGNLERLRQLVGMSARFYEALYDLAGMEFESDRIRQSSHRSTSADEAAGGETPPTEEGEGSTDNGTESASASTDPDAGSASPPASDSAPASDGRDGAQQSAG